MPNVKTLHTSFNGGEVTPEFFGQVSDSKFQTGLATCKNFIVLPHGPVQNRAGFKFVRQAKYDNTQCRLIPFSYNTTQTMVLEFGDGYIRFHTNGGTIIDGGTGLPYQVATPYIAADLFDIHYVQSADVLTLVHPNYAPRELRRYGTTNWTLTPISFASALSAPTGLSAVATGWQTSGTGVLGNSFVDVDDVSGISIGETVTGTGIAAGAVVTRIVMTTYRVWLSLANTGAVNGTLTFYGTNTYDYVVTSVSADGLDESLQSSNATCTGNLLVTNAKNTITWSAAAGASRYNIYKKANSALYGYIGQATGTTFVDDNITSDLSKTPPISNNPFSGSGNYPGAVSYYEQRRCFAGTTNQPQNIWMTKSGSESNMTYSLPTRDDDSIQFRVAAREANTIRHVVPLSNLLLMTSAAEWRVTSVNSDALTPSSISVKPQSYIGASNVQPQIINNTMIYAAARGGHMRELAYNWQASGYVTGDLSLRAPHLFDNLSLVDMAYAKAPYPIVWAVSSSGMLLGLTYVPEQNVGAWHKHDTNLGTFESVCVVNEGDEDAVYVVVKRYINEQYVRYVERMETRTFALPSTAFFVDSGLTHSGSAVTTVTGLGHLEGCTVSILADGAVMPQQVVTGGSVTLQRAATTVHVGLPITADVETLPWAAQVDAAMGQGRYKNVNKVWLRVYRSSGIFVGPDVNNLIEAKQRSTEPYGLPPALKSDEIQVVITPSWQDSGQVVVRQSDPLPLTLLSMTMEVAMGG